jgi:phosphatidylserine/phosphatidylglycerophosphate/cardiolipin synthase-like enzyme
LRSPVLLCQLLCGLYLSLSVCAATRAEPLRLNAVLQSENLEAGTFQLQARLSAPEQLLQQLPQSINKVIKSQFIQGPSPEARHYRLEVEAAGDRFSLLLYWSRPNELSLKVEDNWIPSDWILREVKEALDPLLKNLEKGGLLAQIQISNTDLQVQFAQTPVAGYWSNTGDLWLSIAPSTATFSPSPALKLQAQLDLNATPSESHAGSRITATLQHHIDLNLPESQVKNLTLSGEKIHRRLEALSGNLKGTSAFQGNMLKSKLTGAWQGQLLANLDRLKVKGKTYTDLHAYPFHWRWQWPYHRYSDFEIWPELPPLPPLAGPYTPQFSKARLQYTIDGPIYLKSLREAVKRARYRVQQEVFVFYPGESTRALSRLYWLKAAGLREDQNKLVPDTYAPAGISVEIMHNHQMSPEGATEVNALFNQTQSELLQALKSQGSTATQIAMYTQRMQRHLSLRALARGIIKIDHRKQVIIDNSLAFVGGFNMADHYLTERGFHDIMYQLAGPIVKPLQQAFALNWQALNPEADAFAPQTLAVSSLHSKRLSPPQTDALINSLPRSHSSSSVYTPEVALLLHDHDQNTIKPALLQLINNAKHTLRLEQAYLTEHDIMQALKRAKTRGVNLELVMSYYNDEQIFERLNLASMLALHEAPGAGKVETWLYRGHDKARQTKRANPSYMVHSKYISADGTEAIVGSTNLIPRSLQSPFYGLLPEVYPNAPVLFNEELGLWIKDRATVSALDHDLVKNDQDTRSLLTSAPELQQLLSARGGIWKLLGDRLKGLLG